MKKRVIAVVLILLLLSGCGNIDKDMQSTSGGITIENHGLENTDTISVAEYEKNFKAQLQKMSDEEQIDCLLQYATDMLTCQSQGLLGTDTLNAAQAITNLYPHPLLLNNFATMQLAAGNAKSALETLLLAEKAQSEDTTILINIANAMLATGDLQGATEYAKKALKLEPENGLAYQVLTTVHLANGDSILAAETMLKEGKNCWNDITTYHFQSFMLAVHELDPEDSASEHPFNDNNIRLLYELAKEGVGLDEISSQMDTTESQRRFPFPFPTDANSYRYADLGEMGAGSIHDKCYREYDKLQKEGMKHDLSYEDDLYPHERTAQPTVIRDLRQFWVLELLQQYYEFQIKKAWAQMDRTQIEQLEQSYEDYTGGAYLQRFEQLIELEARGTDIRPSVLALLKEAESQIAATHGQVPLIYKSYYDKEIQPLLEEYWLRMDAALKYVQNKDIQDDFIWRRKDTVTTWSTEGVNTFSGLQVMWRTAMLSIAGIYDDLSANPPAGVQILSVSPPQTEPVVLKPFPEPNPPGNVLSLSAGLLGYKLNFSTDGTNAAIGYETPKGKKEWSRNFSTGETTVLTAKAVGATVPKEAGVLLKTFGDVMGLIIAAPTKEGTYTTYDAKGNITDYGKYKTQSYSLGGVGDFGAGSSMEMRKSDYYAGSVAQVSRARQYGFKFVGLQ